MVALRLNEEEKKALNESLDKIIDFLKEQIPKVRRTIEIRFGESASSYGYIISIDSRRVSGMSGMVHVKFMDEDYIDGRSVYEHDDYAQALVMDWKRIKRIMQGEISQQQSVLQQIIDFEV